MRLVDGCALAARVSRIETRIAVAAASTASNPIDHVAHAHPERLVMLEG
jgi:hypothetical protein